MKVCVKAVKKVFAPDKYETSANMAASKKQANTFL
jgi:hypothetical protein